MSLFPDLTPVNTQVIQNEILELNERGATIIYSTHRMESVEALCDHIALINRSKLILQGAVKSIKDEYRNQTYRIYFHSENGQFPLSEAGLWQQLESKGDSSDSVVIQVDPAHTLNQVLTAVIGQVEIHQILEIVPSMHDIFIDQVTVTNQALPSS